MHLHFHCEFKEVCLCLCLCINAGTALNFPLVSLDFIFCSNRFDLNRFHFCIWYRIMIFCISINWSEDAYKWKSHLVLCFIKLMIHRLRQNHELCYTIYFSKLHNTHHALITICDSQIQRKMHKKLSSENELWSVHMELNSKRNKKKLKRDNPVQWVKMRYAKYYFDMVNGVVEKQTALKQSISFKQWLCSIMSFLAYVGIDRDIYLRHSKLIWRYKCSMNWSKFIGWVFTF